MKRKCIRCGTEMIDNCVAEVDDAYHIFKNIFLYKNANNALKKNIGTMEAAVCPKCGEVSFYIKDVSKI